MSFGVVFGLLNGSDLATQYFTGYLVELCLFSTTVKAGNRLKV
ncbi:MAG TPA: hypothetical protein VI159_10860 [Gemmatimonadales bacterium]